MVLYARGVEGGRGRERVCVCDIFRSHTDDYISQITDHRVERFVFKKKLSEMVFIVLIGVKRAKKGYDT